MQIKIKRNKGEKPKKKEKGESRNIRGRKRS